MPNRLATLRAAGIEPTPAAWKAIILPLNYAPNETALAAYKTAIIGTKLQPNENNTQACLLLDITSRPLTRLKDQIKTSALR